MTKKAGPPNPCMGCEFRRAATKTTPDCHSTCEPYLEYFRHNREQDAIRHQEAEADEVRYRTVCKASALRRILRGKLH